MKLKWPKLARISGLIGIPCVIGSSLALVWHANHRPPTPLASTQLDPAAQGWLDDLRAAQCAARVRQKDVLLEFSAPPDDATAAAFDRDCLDSIAFRAAAAKLFVLVRLSASADMSPARLTQATALAERLGVMKFPTLVLLDTEGKPYAKSDTLAADPMAFASAIEQHRSVRSRRDDAIAAAGAATGIERARYLDAALTVVGTFADSEYPDLVQQLIASDPDNAAGLRAKYEPAAITRRADRAVQNEVYPLIDRGDYSAAIARIDRLIREVNPRHEQLQLLLAFKGQLYFTLGDKRRAAEFLDSAIAVNPTSESAGRARAARAQILGRS